MRYRLATRHPIRNCKYSIAERTRTRQMIVAPSLNECVSQTSISAQEVADIQQKMYTSMSGTTLTCARLNLRHRITTKTERDRTVMQTSLPAYNRYQRYVSHKLASRQSHRSLKLSKVSPLIYRRKCLEHGTEVLHSAVASEKKRLRISVTLLYPLYHPSKTKATNQMSNQIRLLLLLWMKMKSSKMHLAQVGVLPKYIQQQRKRPHLRLCLRNGQPEPKHLLRLKL